MNTTIDLKTAKTIEAMNQKIVRNVVHKPLLTARTKSTM